MNLGCCVHNFNSWSFEEAVRLTHDLGFRFGNIGLGPLGGKEAVLADADAVAARIRGAAETYGFEFRELMVFGVAPAEGAADPLAGWKAWPGLAAVQRGALFLLPADEVSRATPRFVDSLDQACKLLQVLRENPDDE